MSMERFSLSMDAKLGAAVRAAAEEAGMTASAWISQAAADQVRNRLLGIALDRWDEEDGPPTEEEMEQARRDLGLPSRRTAGALLEALGGAPMMDEQTLTRLDEAQAGDRPPKDPRRDE